MIEEEKKNRMVSIMNMHAGKCLLTIYGGGKVIPTWSAHSPVTGGGGVYGH